MLDEKTMVSDALAGVNGELVRYGEMISQTENKELKQKLKQIRNDCCRNFHTLVSNARNTENLPLATSLAYFGI